MKIGKIEIPDSWTVSISVSGGGMAAAYFHGSIVDAVLSDRRSMEEFGFETIYINSASIEIFTLPDCPSDYDDKGEFLARIELSQTEDQECPAPSVPENFTGCIESVPVELTGSFIVPASELSKIALFYSGIQTGKFFFPIDQMSSEGDGYSSDDTFYVSGRPVASLLNGNYSSLMCQLIEDLDFIIHHSVDSAQDARSILVDFSSERLFQMILSMPEDKRKHIICNETLLEEMLFEFTKNRPQPVWVDQLKMTDSKSML